jgi:hypothetical protein
MNLWVLKNVGNFLTSCKPVSFPRSTLHHGVSTCIDVLFCSVSCFKEQIKVLKWCHIDLGCYSPSDNCGGLGSILGQFMLDLLWTQWTWDRFLSQDFGFSVSVLQTHLFIFHWCCTWCFAKGMPKLWILLYKSFWLQIAISTLSWLSTVTLLRSF